MSINKTLIAIGFGLSISFSGSAQAATIVSAIGGVINAGGPGSGTLTETVDQSGLDTNYVSGVTNFDAYIASNPQHTTTFPGFEWFSNLGTNSAQVTYDLGSVLTIDKMALWNEESSGIGSLDLLFSIDNITFVSLLVALVPTDNNLSTGSYSADVFSFAAESMRYIQLVMTRCPQPDPASYAGCAIGEVAFSSVSAVPVPAALPLFASGLGALGFIGWRRKRKAAAAA